MPVALCACVTPWLMNARQAVYVFLCACTSLCPYISVSLHVCVCLCVWGLYVHVSLCVSPCVCVFRSLYVCVFVHGRERGQEWIWVKSWFPKRRWFTRQSNFSVLKPPLGLAYPLQPNPCGCDPGFQQGRQSGLNVCLARRGWERRNREEGEG